MTSTSTAKTIPAEDLYRTLMSEIEPDLLPEHMEKLDEKYADETPDERALRMESYENAFLVFDVALEDATESLHAEVREHKQVMRAKLHTREESEHATEIKNVSQKFNDLPAD